MVRINTVSRLLAFPLLWFSAIQATFAILSVSIFKDEVATVFFGSSLALLVVSGIVWLRTAAINHQTISNQDGLVFAVLTWIVAGFSGAIPIYFITGVSFTDATFESISALTTTGATILVGLDDMPKSFLLYRQFLQWTGGLGVVIFVVAILPMLNIGGMRLLMAETPGPVKNDKVAPRVRSAARYLWLVYVALTLLCASGYWIAGMSLYDAVAHSFTTVSTGGFSTHDASMGYFESELILWVSNVFMILGAISFALHYRANHNRNWLDYLLDEETRVFLVILACVSLGVTIYLFNHAIYDDFFTTLTFAAFHIVSFMTSTGYGATDLSAWPGATALILVFVSYLGGCAGSTAGGNKVIRDIISFKLIRQQLFLLVHPHAVKTIRYQHETVKPTIVSAVLAFMTLAAATTLVFTILMMTTGLDFWSAFTAVSACINVLGPGFGEVSSNFIVVSDTGIWLLNIAMLLGRLEYFTLIALLLPTFWRG
ncbi:TrkH family potassium uptake protein [Pseudidiomarina insulisalsae]|uniref:Trk system potassium uptake protein n=1 Tax=Pseudidiomarina insulisalsae TaxID=575789 RepID=A0A432YA79_9GAMM|nr:potassium transporter TrkG [Pseudidiomarina insulisalsae]RUO57889.1 potassium transporter [Pseudidiomarina insulisalsae]